MATEIMTLRKWYGNSVPIPHYGKPTFVSFVAGSIGIVNSILQKHFERKVRIVFSDVPTAHADQAKGQVVVNEDFLKGRIGPGYPVLGSDESISLILGIIVHEAAHFAYSPATLKPWGEHIHKHTVRPYVQQVAFTLGNTIEDIFIEAEVGRRVPAVSWMLDCTNNLFFGVRSFTEVVEKAQHVTAAPDNLQDVATVLNLLIYAKVRASVTVNPWLDELFAVVRSATETTKILDRFALALQVYERLMENIRAESDEDAGEDAPDTCTNSGSGEDSEGKSKGSGSTDEKGKAEKEGSGLPDAVRKALDKALAAAKGLTADSDKQESGKAGYPDRTARDIECRTAEVDGAELSMGPSGGVGSGAGIIYMEETLSLRGATVEADERYDRLVELGRQRASVNRPYGLDKTRGTHIRKLHRIATDQKIFAEPVRMSGYKPMQVLILIDCSSSMYGWSTDDREVQMITAAVKAALGAARGLVEAHCDVAVYGHTAYIHSTSAVNIYRLKTFIEPVTVLPDRLGRLLQGDMLAQNKDGYAIEYVAKKFTARDKRRLLIVISDGAPSAPDYGGREADYHTRDAVNAVRRSGIDVLSISITGNAAETNDLIYGKENNVFNHDPNVIEQIVKSLLVKD